MSSYAALADLVPCDGGFHAPCSEPVRRLRIFGANFSPIARRFRQVRRVCARDRAGQGAVLRDRRLRDCRARAACLVRAPDRLGPCRAWVSPPSACGDPRGGLRGSGARGRISGGARRGPRRVPRPHGSRTRRRCPRPAAGSRARRAVRSCPRAGSRRRRRAGVSVRCWPPSDWGSAVGHCLS